MSEFPQALPTYTLSNTFVNRIHELLWNLYRAGARESKENIRLRLFQNQITRRSVRRSRPDELEAFNAWVFERPRRDTSGAIDERTNHKFKWELVNSDNDDEHVPSDDPDE